MKDNSGKMLIDPNDDLEDLEATEAFLRAEGYTRMAGSHKDYDWQGNEVKKPHEDKKEKNRKVKKKKRKNITSSSNDKADPREFSDKYGNKFTKGADGDWIKTRDGSSIKYGGCGASSGNSKWGGGSTSYSAVKEGDLLFW